MKRKEHDGIHDRYDMYEASQDACIVAHTPIYCKGIRLGIV